jgi:hypothetical protein
MRSDNDITALDTRPVRFLKTVYDLRGCGRQAAETGVAGMSLIDSARALARDEFQMGCAVEHVFLAALPPLGYKNLDDEAR